MKTDIIRIDNQGDGFTEALDMVDRTAAYARLENKSALQLSLLAQEMLCLARSITGDMQADFWIELTDGQFNLHMSTKTLMDADKRSMLIEAASSRKNEAAHSLLGKLRDSFEKAMLSEGPERANSIPDELMHDVYYSYTDQEWDKYESSVLRKLADDIKISIRGKLVELTVCKSFTF